MKDFPLFPCANGMASLILCEIPYRGDAYIFIRALHGSLSGLLQECGNFCRAAGAENIYVCGECDLSHLPVYAHLTERSLPKARLPQSNARAELTEDSRWAELYNERFRNVHSAKTYLCTPQNAYFVYDGEELIGFGQLIDDELAAVAALKKGRGQDCVCALSAKLQQESIKLLCAEENLPATRLYDRMGFSRDKILRVWYRWLP